MATTYLTPDSDVTANWDTSTGATHWDEINDDVTSSGSDTTYVETVTLTDDDRYSFTNTPSNTNQVTAVSVRIRCGITDVANAAYIAVSLYHSGNPGTQVGSTQNIVIGGGANEVANDGTVEMVTKTWSGLTLTKAEADGLQVKVVFNNA